MSVAHNSLFIAKLHTIDWFSNCGTKSIEQPIILKEINKSTWENLILEERGNFTATLAREHREFYKEWNTLVRQFKQDELPVLQARWEQALAPHHLNEPSILLDISSIVLNIAQLKAYEGYLAFPVFFSELLAIYESGRLPYGWKGSKTTGHFLIY